MMKGNETDHHRREIRRALTVCLPYLLIIFFLDDIDKALYAIHSHFGDPLIALYIFIATVIVISLLIHCLIELPLAYRALGPKAAVPTLIYIIALTNSFWSPLRISAEVFHSRIVHRAYRRSQFGHDNMKLRANGSLDIRYPGPFGMCDWEYGRWRANGDTFYLDYDQGADTAAVKPDTLILSSGLLTPVGIPSDTLAIYKERFFRMAPEPPHDKVK